MSVQKTINVALEVCARTELVAMCANVTVGKNLVLWVGRQKGK